MCRAAAAFFLLVSDVQTLALPQRYAGSRFPWSIDAFTENLVPNPKCYRTIPHWRINCLKNYHYAGSPAPLDIALRRSQNTGMPAYLAHFRMVSMIWKPSSVDCLRLLVQIPNTVFGWSRKRLRTERGTIAPGNSGLVSL